MKNQVSIHIVSVHKSEGRKEEEFQTTVTGTCMRRERMHYISYTESAAGDGADPSSEESLVHTLLKMGPEKLEVKKTGVIGNHMVFEPGKRHVCLYRTAYGILEFEITGVTWQFARTGTGLEGHVQYRLRAGGEPLSDCEMTIHIKYERSSGPGAFSVPARG